jgi:hypothetical protein
MSIKVKLHQLCLAKIEEQIFAIKQSIDDARSSELEETKSSAGDKYETGRAMMHLEIEKLDTQLAEAEKTKSYLLQINPNIVSQKVQVGSLVYTNAGNYYLSVSTGTFTIDGEKFITLSSASPLGAKLVGLGAGSEMLFNNKSIRIELVS